MFYRALGKTGVRVSAISFGTMRWKSEADCYAVIARGLELGLNYLDTSTGYVDGKSLGWCGDIIAKTRDKALVSSKSNWASAPDADAVQRSIEAALKQAGLDYFDFYQLWGLPNLDVLKSALSKNGFVAGVRKAQKRGLIRHGLGFTFHGNSATFKAAVDSGEFVSATVSYSLLNRCEEPLLNYAAANGMGVIIMNPLAGGLLAKQDDDSLAFLRHKEFGPWYGGLRFLLANPNITTSLVGFANALDLEQDIKALRNSRGLTKTFREKLGMRIAGAKLAGAAFCTGCGYCRVCPRGFDPSYFMQAYRDFSAAGTASKQLANWLDSHYMHGSPAKELAKCRECGLCEKNCPQGLKIVSSIQQAKADLKNQGEHA